MQKCELLRTKSFLKYFHGKNSFDAFVKETHRRQTSRFRLVPAAAVTSQTAEIGCSLAADWKTAAGCSAGKIPHLETNFYQKQIITFLLKVLLF